MSKEKNTFEHIEDAYLAFVADHKREPFDLEEFLQDTKIDKVKFSSAFNSLTELRERLWLRIYDETVERLTAEEVFHQYPVREKLLALYFTWFEVLVYYLIFKFDRLLSFHLLHY